MRVFSVLVLAGSASAIPALVSTTTGLPEGTLTDGVSSFKGVRFAHAPTGSLRWEPPVEFISTSRQNATTLGPSCIQQFAFATATFIEGLFNNLPPPESEDCLFLNVWTPASSSSEKLPVMVWIYGGSLAFGTASLPLYDGTSFAKNQNVVVVTLNYRTNVFGFPGSPDLPLTGNNLGYLDQELALRWVRNNVAKFGGDPEQVTIMGQSAGSKSVAAAILRYSAANAPFRAAVLLSGAEESTSPVPSFASFDGFSTAVNCTQTPGPARLACLKNVPASVIRSFTNGPSSGAFGPIVDNVTRFSDPIQRLRDGLTANVPFIMGNMQDDGTLFAFGLTDLPAFLETNFGSSITVNQVRPLYPGLNDSAIISEIEKDFLFLCPAQLWTGAAVSAGIKDIYRYTYGAVFADLQLFPGAGAWHSSEIQEIFGTFNSTTATPAEATLSYTMQTLIANFIKNPAASPAPNWPRYVPGRKTKTLAKLAYEGNVALGDVVQVAESDEVDGPCELWDTILDVRE